MIHVDGYHTTQDECDAIKAAVEVLNKSETIAVAEENDNYHSASSYREELASSVHVAQVAEWRPEQYDPELYEVGTCSSCGREVVRDAGEWRP